VLPDGKLAPLDLTPAKLVLQADGADMKASKAGMVGISSLIAGRRIQEQNTGNLSSTFREGAFERATVQILDRIQGHSVVGVRLYDCWNAKSQLLIASGRQVSVITLVLAPRILARCHVAVGTTTAREQELTGPFVGGL
jgi:hypothetical protein